MPVPWILWDTCILTPRKVHPAFSSETFGIFGRNETPNWSLLLASLANKDGMAPVDVFNQRLVAWLPVNWCRISSINSMRKTGNKVRHQPTNHCLMVMWKVIHPRQVSIKWRWDLGKKTKNNESLNVWICLRISTTDKHPAKQITAQSQNVSICCKIKSLISHSYDKKLSNSIFCVHLPLGGFNFNLSVSLSRFPNLSMFFPRLCDVASGVFHCAQEILEGDAFLRMLSWKVNAKKGQELIFKKTWKPDTGS